MAFLFSYGTLQDKNIQKSVFDRVLKGNPDMLPGFALSPKKAYGQYPMIRKATDLSTGVDGMVYEISDRELEQIDAYEGEEYTRVHADLKSGKKAWVYIAR